MPTIRPHRRGPATDDAPSAAADRRSGQAPVSTNPKLRRSPLAVALGGLLVVAGALISVGAYTQLSNAQEVIAVVAPVARGERLERGDLQVVRVGIDPALHLIPAEQMAQLIGQYAIWDLPQGSLVTVGAVGPSVVPHKGRAEVGLALAPGRLPGNQLVIGDQVRVVSVPDPGAADSQVRSWPATVVDVSPPDGNRTVVVGVELEAAVAPEVAALSASGRVALVLDARER
ncbi:MAG: SAF domain-containing protein [Propionibacteriaceae bacterium]|nr:SAF domain-containing protein [Propionibacteriaceae bacterium]